MFGSHFGTGIGVYRIVANVSNASLVQFKVWANGVEKWYGGDPSLPPVTADAAGNYYVDFAMADFGNVAGMYNFGVNVYDLAGKARHIGNFTATVTKN